MTMHRSPLQDADYSFAVEPVSYRVRAHVDGVAIASSDACLVMWESGLAPVYYFSKSDIQDGVLTRAHSGKKTFCPFKGTATHWSVTADGHTIEDAAWSYELPLEESEAVAGHVAFYRNKVTVEAESGDIAPLSETRPDPTFARLSQWLAFQAFASPTPEIFVERLASQLLELGMGLRRINVSIWTLHPELAGTIYFWQRGQDDVKVSRAPLGFLNNPKYLDSPMRHVTDGLGGVRQRLDVENPEFRFPVMDDLRALGCTDYVAMPLPFSDGGMHVLTLAGDDPQGFTTAQLGMIFRNLGVIARILEVHAQRQTTAALLETYLGRRSGRRVLEGATHRGDGERIEAAILFCDLRDSTRYADRLNRAEFLNLLNSYFETVMAPIEANGGEVLKLIGDAVLAIFPVEDDVASAARKAAAAARAAVAEVQALDPLREGTSLRCALSLHMGEVMYGNAGAPHRLDFTVAGTAVHETARLNEVCKQLDRPVVMSAALARHLDDGVVALGPQSLRDLGPPRPVFTLA